MKPIRAINTFIDAMFGRLMPAGRVWAWIGLFVLSAGASMSWAFGWQVSWIHAAFLGGLTAVAAFGPHAAHKAFEERKYGAGTAVALGSAMLLLIQLGVDQSYTAGIRGFNRDTTNVQNVKYNSRQDSVKESKTDLAMWSKRLADLEEQNKWAGTVTADALRAQLASANLAIDLEAKRGGCKALCLARTKERDDINSKIAIAEERGELTRKIEATRRVVDSAREVAVKTEHKSSAVAHANDQIAKAVAFIGFGSLAPSSEISEGADIGTNLAMAMAATIVPALTFFIAGLYRRPDDDQPTASAPITHDHDTLTRAAPQDGYSKPAPTISRIHAKSVGECMAEARAIMAGQRAQAA